VRQNAGVRAATRCEKPLHMPEQQSYAHAPAACIKTWTLTGVCLTCNYQNVLPVERARQARTSEKTDKSGQVLAVHALVQAWQNPQ
jgi:hypothetical protein